MADRSNSEDTAVSSEAENAVPTTNGSPKNIGKTMSPSLIERGSESTCSDLLLSYGEVDNAARPRCTCPSCPQHGSPAKVGDRRLEEFMRRSALHMINAARR
jgi:hypothetical protein